MSVALGAPLRESQSSANKTWTVEDAHISSPHFKLVKIRNTETPSIWDGRLIWKHGDRRCSSDYHRFVVSSLPCPEPLLRRCTQVHKLWTTPGHSSVQSLPCCIGQGFSTKNTDVSHLRRGGLHQGWMNLSHQRVSHVIICYKLECLRICSRNVHKCWNFQQTSNNHAPNITSRRSLLNWRYEHCLASVLGTFHLVASKNITEAWWPCWHAQIQSSSNVWLSMRFKHKLYSKPEKYQRSKSNQELCSVVTSSGTSQN